MTGLADLSKLGTEDGDGEEVDGAGTDIEGVKDDVEGLTVLSNAGVGDTEDDDTTDS